MAYPGKCCRSTPRCRDCPARQVGGPITLRAELQELLRPRGGDVPEHLAGVPRCLHKYEPLFRRQAKQEPEVVATAQAPARTG